MHYEVASLSAHRECLWRKENTQIQATLAALSTPSRRIVAYGQSVGRRREKFCICSGKRSFFNRQVDIERGTITLCFCCFDSFDDVRFFLPACASGPATALASKKPLGGVVLHSSGAPREMTLQARRGDRESETENQTDQFK